MATFSNKVNNKRKLHAMMEFDKNTTNDIRMIKRQKIIDNKNNNHHQTLKKYFGTSSNGDTNITKKQMLPPPTDNNNMIKDKNNNDYIIRLINLREPELRHKSQNHLFDESKLNVDLDKMKQYFKIKKKMKMSK